MSDDWIIFSRNANLISPDSISQVDLLSVINNESLINSGGNSQASFVAPPMALICVAASTSFALTSGMLSNCEVAKQIISIPWIASFAVLQTMIFLSADIFLLFHWQVAMIFFAS